MSDFCPHIAPFQTLLEELVNREERPYPVSRRGSICRFLNAALAPTGDTQLLARVDVACGNEGGDTVVAPEHRLRSVSGEGVDGGSERGACVHAACAQPQPERTATLQSLHFEDETCHTTLKLGPRPTSRHRPIWQGWLNGCPPPSWLPTDLAVFTATWPALLSLACLKFVPVGPCAGKERTQGHLPARFADDPVPQKPALGAFQYGFRTAAAAALTFNAGSAHGVQYWQRAPAPTSCHGYRLKPFHVATLQSQKCMYRRRQSMKASAL
eukprot:365122-Chlamydomonas_euryale.AAC.13